MFYDIQPKKQREKYKEMLQIIGSLSNIFSESDEPMLYYRAHENIFCKYFQANNLSREDCSADASKGNIGVGLKTWVGNNDQKIAEFGKLKPQYKDLSGIDLIKRIAEYRNARIQTTKALHNITSMFYHVVKRIPHAMQILECSFDPIDINNIEIIENRGNENNTYFTDKRHVYHFSTSKNTLYMIFDSLIELDHFEVNIIDDPYEALKTMSFKIFSQRYKTENKALQFNKVNQICLRLYSFKNNQKVVFEKSGLNQWNAGGRTRDPNELYIPYPKEDREKTKGFFPPQDTIFKLKLPDGTIMDAKICQQEGKAIMSNPNKALGKWLLRDVFKLPEKTIVTYEMLQIFGIDSVIFTKKSELEYTIDFCNLDTYENLKGKQNTEIDE
ncbi:MAG: hypothetical protein ACI4V7_08650 [Succinivibrionaceae bacterium]